VNLFYLLVERPTSQKIDKNITTSLVISKVRNMPNPTMVKIPINNSGIHSVICITTELVTCCYSHPTRPINIKIHWQCFHLSYGYTDKSKNIPHLVM